MPLGPAAESVHDRTIADWVRELLGRERPVTVLGPSAELLAAVTVGIFEDPPVGADTRPPVVVAERGTLETIDDTFGVAHRVSELADRGLVEFRVGEAARKAGPLLAGSGRVVTVVDFERSYGLVEVEDDRLRSLGRDRAARARESAARYEFDDRPEWRTVTTTLQERTNRETLEELLDGLAARRAAPAGRTLDVPTVALLAGARTEAPQKGIAQWCESCDIAAASTVSNRKSALAEHGLVTTKRAPPDGVGAPVHRLTVGDAYLAEQSMSTAYDIVADLFDGT